MLAAAGRAIAALPPLAVLGIAWAVFLVYAFPGVMTQDSFDHLREARAGIYSDAHPPIINLVWKVSEQLIAGREKVWLPRRWRTTELAGPRRQRFTRGLLRMIRRLERFSRPRARFLFDHRASNAVFGGLVAAGSLAAFLAPPFTGLDTLPSLGVVLISLGVLLEDIAIVAAGGVVGAAGVALEIFLGRAALHGISSLFG